ncbi:acetate--CoA ligase family protein [Rhodococcus sp. IEGM 1366]|uniref:acetate--CoA ligase family protein n=1 Tax=Rhodococcus sp. IEGM 1366 TaxID=3082223 RepID=UPI0029551D55|nr:acetate--CoA ligase family protein [Rhodococcus sp. IEGM 1366]MDV8070916.1 acetate--CoA ligase family protein [Rhodococcus sp. IEGM 1366]
MSTDTRGRLYDALVRPGTVAIVGASDDPAKTTSRPLRNLADNWWAGRVYVVNPNRDTIAGHRAYDTIADLPEVPDHVFILTGADPAIAVARECARMGVPVVSIMADGFVGGSPESRARMAALEEISSTAGTRILGPSSLGVVSPAQKLVLTANAAFAEPLPVGGGIFVASQSGSAIGALASRGKDAGIAFHTMISTGSEVNLSVGEICLASVDDPEVTSYILFLENLSHAGDLAAFARAAAERGKPVLAFKLGRSDAAAELAVSHTGALAGDDAIADAALRDLGITRVSTFDALLEAHPLACSTRGREIARSAPRVAVVSTTGGGGAMMVDCLAMAGAEPTRPTERTRAELAAVGIDAGGGTLVDLTLAGTRYEVMKSALDILLAAPEFDVVVAVPGSSARFHSEHAVKPIVDASGGGKPLAAFVVPSAPDALRMLRVGGVSAFRSPEACADAIVSVFAYRPPRVGTLPTRAVPSATSVLDEQSSYRVFAELGVPYAPFAVLDTAGPLREIPVTTPAAVKIHAAGLAHKSDLGGVVLGVGDAEGLKAAVGSIMRSVVRADPSVPTGQVLVQQMVRGLGEALIGFRVDPDVGPIVLLAAGGVLAELHKDRSVRLAPVDADTAQEMIDEVTAFRALAGFRGLPKGDLAALRDAVVAMSHAAGLVDSGIVELEANPVMVCAEGKGVFAVDAVVRTVSESLSGITQSPPVVVMAAGTSHL